jgi:hypothetical protein
MVSHTMRRAMQAKHKSFVMAGLVPAIHVFLAHRL